MERVLIFVLALFLAGCSIPFLGGNKSGLKIMTTPVATVILDGKQAGQTPFDQSNLNPKSYKVQLIPQSGQPWEATITLRDNLQTVIERNFGENEQFAAGYIMELEPSINKSESQISIVTIPDFATIRVDGQPKGFAPLTTTLSTEGMHEIAISSAGYMEKNVQVSAPKGYVLRVTVQLARGLTVQPTPAPISEELPDLTPAPTPKKSSILTVTPNPKKIVTVTPTPLARPYVEILATGTKATADALADNWLRVRSAGNQSASVVGYVYTAETYKFIESNDAGWYHIQFSEDIDGWVSSQYAKLYK